MIKGEATDADLAAAAAGFAKARDLVNSGEYDLVVLDELVTALFFELVPLDDVLALLLAKPSAVELVHHRPPRARRARRGGRSGHRDAAAEALLRRRRTGALRHRVLERGRGGDDLVVPAPPDGRIAAVTHTLIYPHTTVHNAAGHLEIGGCDVVDLARSYGTPLFIYDEQTLRDQCRAYHVAFGARVSDYEIVYASKAFSCRAMAELVAQEDLSLDVATGGELAAARAAGFPPGRIYFHGNNKSVAEIEAGLDVGIGHFVVDSFEEIERLEAAVAARGGRQEVLVRVTPGRAAQHARLHPDRPAGQQVRLRPGRRPRRGGGAPPPRRGPSRARRRARPHRLADLRAGLVPPRGRGAVHRPRRLASRLRLRCRIFNIGGGLGIRYTEADQPSSIAEFAEVSVTAVREGAGRHGMAMPRLFVEPGRSIAGKAAVTAYTVGTVKVIPGVRTYVAVDGGMSDNLRPMLYDSRYEAMLASKAEAPATDVVTVAGKHCESGDVLVRDVHIAPPEPGDILVTPSTGAYGYAMANNYNAQPRPAVVMVGGGEARVIIERETWDDVLRLQRPLAQ